MHIVQYIFMQQLGVWKEGSLTIMVYDPMLFCLVPICHDFHNFIQIN